jgi:hypothetical protein
VPLAAGWRKWPSDTVPQQRDVSKLWTQVSESHIKGASAVAAFVDAAGESVNAGTDGSPAPVDEPAAAASIAHRELLYYGSRRPLSEKERGYHQDKMEEQRARRLKAELKAAVAEQAAKAELETKRRRHELLRAKQRSARTARADLSKAERDKIQQRLYATPRRERAGAVYG